MKEITDIHIGKHIREIMAQKGIKVPWIAQQLCCHRNNIYLIFSRQWIDTNTLMKLSFILQYDFFEELSELYKEHNIPMMKPSRATITSPARSSGRLSSPSQRGRKSVRRARGASRKAVPKR